MVVNLSWCRFLLVFQEGSNYGSSRIARGPIMEIDNVRREDAGTYMCTASNNVGTMSADEIDLRVLCKFFRDFFTTKDEPSFLKRYFIDHNLLLYAYGSNLTVRTNASFCLDLLGHPSVPSIFQWAFRSQSNESERPKWKMAFFQLWFYILGLFSKKWCFSSDFAPPCTCVTKVWKESLLFCDTEFAQEYEFEFQNHVFFFRFFTASPLEAKNFFRRTVIEVTLITFVKLFCFSLASLMKLS